MGSEVKIKMKTFLSLLLWITLIGKSSVIFSHLPPIFLSLIPFLFSICYDLDGYYHHANERNR